MAAVFFAHVDELAPLFRLFENIGIGQPIVDNHIRPLNQPKRFDRQQVDIARPGSRQIDFTHSIPFFSMNNEAVFPNSSLFTFHFFLVL